MDIQRIVMLLKTIISSIGKFIDILANYFERISTYFNMFHFVAITFIVVIIMFINRTNNGNSKKEIKKLIKNKKYIPHLFVELDESKECLRYFVYHKKWKKKLVDEYNALFQDYFGSILKSAFAYTNAVFEVENRDDLDSILSSMNRTKQYLEDLRKGEELISLQYRESLIKFRVFGDMYGKQLQELLIKTRAIKDRYCVVTGNAGNGKTNLLCNISELLIKRRKRCFFIDAKTITGELENHIWNMLPIFGKINNGIIKKAFWIIQNVFKKEVFVVIDAINENDILSTDQITNSINDLLKNKSVRLIISCRNEFFETKFKECLIDNVDESSTIINTEEMEYDTNSKKRLFDVYKEAFNYTGIVSEYVKEKLMDQLLMMRIFFEVNEKSDEENNDLNTHTLINRYIKKIKEETGINVENYLDTVSENMLNTSNYNYINISSLKDEDKRIQDAIEGTLLTSKTMIKNENTLYENEQIKVQFVFDEVRDYCLARKLLNQASNGSLEYPSDKEIIGFIKRLMDEKAVCSEGVIKYIYRDSHEREKVNICEYILNNCAEDIDSRGDRFRIKSLKWDLSLILDSSDELFDCEMAHLEKAIVDDSFDTMNQLFPYLYKQELYGGKYDLTIILNILRKIEDREKLSSIVRSCFLMYGPNSMSKESIIKYDESLEEKNLDGVKRFREIVLLYCWFYDWPDKKKVLEYLEDKDAESTIKRIKKDYKCFDKEENNDN